MVYKTILLIENNAESGPSHPVNFWTQAVTMTTMGISSHENVKRSGGGRCTGEITLGLFYEVDCLRDTFSRTQSTIAAVQAR